MDLLVRLVLGLILLFAMQTVMAFFPSVTGVARITIVMVVALGVPTVFSWFYEIRRRRVSALSAKRGMLS